MKIIVTPDDLTSAASTIDNLAADYEKLYTDLFSEVGALQSSWQGKDNAAFTNQIEGFRPDFVEIFDGLYSSNPTKLKDHAINVFEEYAVKQYPEIEEIKSALYKMGAFSAFMTGSGSCIVGLFKKDPHLMLLGEKYRKTAMVERFINK